jgi:hypothetical protein
VGTWKIDIYKAVLWLLYVYKGGGLRFQPALAVRATRYIVLFMTVGPHVMNSVIKVNPFMVNRN